MVTRVAEVYSRRGILWLLIGRDLKVKYAESVLGYLWSVLDPLMMAGIYWFVFTVIFNRGDIGHQPYIVFLLSGLLAWNWTNGVLSDASRAITSEAKLVRSTRLPREIWVLRTVGSKFAEFLLSLPVLALFMAIFNVGASGYALLLPLAVMIQGALLTGCALVLAAVTVLARDVQRLVRILLRVLFYLSPVIYSVDQVFSANLASPIEVVYSLNPLTGILTLYHAALFPQAMTELSGGVFNAWEIVAISASVSLVVLVFGAWVFRRLEGAVLKEI